MPTYCNRRIARFPWWKQGNCTGLYRLLRGLAL